MSVVQVVRKILTPLATLQLVVGWSAVLALRMYPQLLDTSRPTGVLVVILGMLIAVIVVSAFGVVTQAEFMARSLGEPYGTLVLTLSIVIIEVILISAVMFGPGDHTTIGRDSVMAVSMIILNLVVGLALLTAGYRRVSTGSRPQGEPQVSTGNQPGLTRLTLHINRAGVRLYLVLLVVMLSAAFALPRFIGAGGAYRPAQAITIAVFTVGIYAYFLYRQMGSRRADFQEVPGTTDDSRSNITETLRLHRTEISLRAAVLVLTVIPIMLLSHHMATVLDVTLDRVGAPVALSGIIIATIVFLPETITAIRAAAQREMQRVSNLCHGALLSTVCLTIPAVLVIGLLTNQVVILGEGTVNLVFLALTLVLTYGSFLGSRVHDRLGWAHLLLFLGYIVAVFM